MMGVSQHKHKHIGQENRKKGAYIFRTLHRLTGFQRISVCVLCAHNISCSVYQKGENVSNGLTHTNPFLDTTTDINTAYNNKHIVGMNVCALPSHRKRWSCVVGERATNLNHPPANE